MIRLSCVLPALILLSACGMAPLGRAPAMTDPAPVTTMAPRPASIAAPAQPAATATSASLFRNGAGDLFADQRARNVGDILTLKIAIDDSAALANSTTRNRESSQSGGISSFFGIDRLVRDLIGLDTSSLVGASSQSDNSGTGTSRRSEKLRLTLAASVVERLPNGNLLIRASQETRVGHELRELIVMGVVRPADIARDNSIGHDRIAEMRLSYGGKGHLTAAQQTRWGQSIIEAIMPF